MSSSSPQSLRTAAACLRTLPARFARALAAPRRRTAAWCVGLVLAVLCGGPLRAEVSKEYQIKAAYIYNFTKFVEWPPRRFANKTMPIVIGVFGGNPFGEELEKIVRGRKVNGRKITIVAAFTLEEAKAAHVVFIGASAEKQVEEHLDALHAAGVLTVGESEQFAAQRGVIGFARVEDKVRFEINVRSARRAGLKISAQLQKLATCVHCDR